VSPVDRKRLGDEDARVERQGRGSDVAIEGPLGDLARAMGGVDKLIAELGVSRRTINYWATGDRKPQGPAKKLLATLAERHGTPNPFPDG
jgi:hypothetical protein